MENRDAVLADYFNLRLILNRTNLVRNQKTEIVLQALRKGAFEYRLIATLAGVSNPKYLELCKTNAFSRWEASEHSGLFWLEEFCASYLEASVGTSDSLEEIVTATKQLHNELRSLGIAR